MTFRKVERNGQIHVEDHFGRVYASFAGIVAEAAADNYMVWAAPKVMRVTNGVLQEIISMQFEPELQDALAKEFAEHHLQCFAMISGPLQETLHPVRRGNRKIWSCHPDCPSLKKEKG